MLKKLPTFLIVIFLIAGKSATSQLTINGAQFFIQSGGVVTVQGDLTSNVDILGTGKILLKGTSNQNVNMGGFTIPNLEIDNVANATLTGNTRIGTSLLFTNGKIFAGNFNLNLADVATVSGMGTSKFVETNGTGQVMKELNANVTSNEIPVGAGTSYRPTFLTTVGTGATIVGVKVLAVADPNKPPMISDYITAYWPITRSTLTGTLTVAGQYIDAGDISGTEANLRGYYFNGTDWSSASETHNNATNQISTPVTASSGNLSALDKFNLLKAKAFLQGAYNTSTGVMDDNLRTGGYLAAITSDPYRTAPYNTSFTHVANALTENVIGTPFANSLVSVNDNIVDWVFLELRNNLSPGSVVLQTRSALIQRDGDIVDVDGLSPVTFNNIASGNYTIAVRHRNHLGISADNVANQLAMSETKSTATLLNFTVAGDALIYGSSAAFTISSDGKTLLWGGNANSNANSKYQGPANDRATILTDLSNNELSTLTGYYRSDVNMNGQVKYQGPSNDRGYLLSTVLANNELTVRTQELPN